MLVHLRRAAKIGLFSLALAAPFSGMSSGGAGLSGFIGTAVAASAVAAVVNDLPVTATDVQQRANLLKLGHEKGSALDDIINDILKVQEARRYGFSVSDAETSDAIQNIAKGIKMTPEQLGTVLSRSGSSIATLRQRIGAQLAFSKLVRARMQSTVHDDQRNREADAVASGKINERTVNDYSLRRVVFIVPRTAGAGRAAEAMRDAEALRREFKSCEAGLDLVRKYKSAVIVNIGHKLNADIPAPLTKILDSTPEGTLTAPEKDTTGVVMVAVCQKFSRTEKVVADGSEGLTPEKLNAAGQKIADGLLRAARQKAVIVYPK